MVFHTEEVYGQTDGHKTDRRADGADHSPLLANIIKHTYIYCAWRKRCYALKILHNTWEVLYLKNGSVHVQYKF